MVLLGTGTSMIGTFKVGKEACSKTKCLGKCYDYDAFLKDRNNASKVFHLKPVLQIPLSLEVINAKLQNKTLSKFSPEENFL